MENQKTFHLGVTVSMKSAGTSTARSSSMQELLLKTFQFLGNYKHGTFHKNKLLNFDMCKYHIYQLPRIQVCLKINHLKLHV